MDNKNLLDLSDLQDVFAELEKMEDVDAPQSEEEKASQKRYEDIIKKHKND